MIEPPAATPQEGARDTVRWFCLMVARLKRDDPWWLPPSRLVAPKPELAQSSLILLFQGSTCACFLGSCLPDGALAVTQGGFSE
jgi:hypothetical protein